MQIKLSLLSVSLLSLLALLISTGCGQSEPEYVEIERAEADPHAGHDHSAMEQQDHAAHSGAQSAENIDFSYEVPGEWTETPPSTMKVLSLVAGKPPEILTECAVSVFPGDVGGQLANINRWRRQVGLGPINPDAVDGFVQELTVSGMEAWQVDFTGPIGTGANGGAARSVITVLFHDGRSWFFKLSGNDAAVEEELGAYREFLESVKF